MSNTKTPAQLPEGFTLRRTLKNHTERITRFAWSPDGQRLATPSVDETIRIWDVNTGKTVQKFEGHEKLVTGVTWSPDGKSIATSSDDFTVRIWDVDSGQQLLHPFVHSNIVTGVAWSPNGEKIATSSDDGKVRLWDVAGRSLFKELNNHTDRVLSVAWSPDGSMLASASWDGTVRLWDGNSGNVRLSPLSHRNHKVFHVAWSHDGRMLASGGFDSAISVWDATTGTRLVLLEGHKATVLSVSFSSDSSLLASRAEDGTVRVRRVSTWESMQLDIPGTWPYSGLAFNPKLPVLAALGEFDRVVYIWDLNYEAIFNKNVGPGLAAGSEGKLYVLHLSDIHLGTKDQARKYFVQLKNDLNHRLEIRRLDYLVVSGDITDRATQDQFGAAHLLLNDIAGDFKLAKRQIVLAPGNHDLSWDAAEDAYAFKFKRKLPKSPEEGDERYIPLGDVGWLERDETLYLKRFEDFANFYQKICGQKYPLQYDEQGILHRFSKNRVLFLTLNSSWNLDSHYKTRTSIHSSALPKALYKIADKHDGWLKIAVWHHPVSGRETMDDAFLEQLAAHDFQIVMHGHVHRPVKQFYEFDSRYGMRIIGAGTFGAPVKEQVPGIPLQYNLLILDPETRNCTIHIGKKENPDGAWTAYGSYSMTLERWSRGAFAKFR
jgi:WD40 repeat protein